jgi:hypothetical protein
MAQPETEMLAGVENAIKTTRQRRIIARIIIVLAYVGSCAPLYSFRGDFEIWYLLFPLSIAPAFIYGAVLGGSDTAALSVVAGILMLGGTLWTLFRPNLIAAILLAVYFLIGGAAIFMLTHLPNC